MTAAVDPTPTRFYFSVPNHHSEFADLAGAWEHARASGANAVALHEVEGDHDRQVSAWRIAADGSGRSLRSLMREGGAS